MITFSVEPRCNISQESYRAKMKKLPLKRMRCSRCGCVGRLTRHAYYRRAIKSAGRKITLTVERLKCSKCNHTHAVVPSYIVPCCQVTLWEQIEIIRQFTRGLGISEVMEKNPTIDENLSYSILRRYRERWLDRFPPESVPHMSAEEISRRCFSDFGRQFMQVRDIPNEFFY